MCMCSDDPKPYMILKGLDDPAGVAKPLAVAPELIFEPIINR